MQRLLFMARRTRCPRGCVVSGHWCVIPSTDRSIHGAVEKSMPNPVRKPICPLENWSPKVCTSDPEAQSYPCITRALFGMLPSARNSKFWPLITVSNKVSLQNQLQNPRASDPEESNEAFDRAIRRWYCSITTANYRLITVIRFVVKSYTHP